MGLLPLLILLSACPSKDDDTANPPPPSHDTAGGDTGASEAAGDEALLRALIEGEPPDEAEVESVLGQVALSGGLPVRTDEGFLFAAACEGDWNLTGDWNGWTAEPLQHHGALCWAELEVPEPEDCKYKYWDGAETWVPDPWARRYTYDEYGEVSLVRARMDHLERWPGFQGGQGLDARTLRVWVPEGGFDRVLYAHDGQNLFDPEAPWGGWRLQDSLPDGILVVGIDNTPARDEEYTHVPDLIGGQWEGGEADRYAALVQEDIRPFIEEHYGAPGRVGVMGSSLGGLVSLYIAHLYPGEYDFAASLSGTLGWGSIGAHEPTMIELYAQAGHRDTVIYLDSGGGPGCPEAQGDACADLDGDGIQDDVSLGDNYCETAQMRDTLAGLGYVFEQDLWHWNEPCAEHNEAAWAARVDLPLGIFAGL